MRESNNNLSQKNKAKNQTAQQQQQLSQRSSQSHHQKANSLSVKQGYPLQHQIISYEDQQQIQGTMNQQPSGTFKQYTKQPPILDTLIHSKMAQILLKGPGPATGVAIGGNFQQQNIGFNQQSVHPQQLQASSNFTKHESLAVKSQLVHQNQLQQNITSNSILAGASASHQTSFNNQNEATSYSIDYQQQKNPQFYYEEYDDVQQNANIQQSQINLQNYYHQQQQLFMNQVPSSKQIIKNMPINSQNQQMSLDNYIQQQPNLQSSLNEHQNPQIHKQTANSQQKQQNLLFSSKGQSSAQKTTKKPLGNTNQNSGHQRTKSDTYYNRGSITSQNKHNLAGSAQQPKRSQGNSNMVMKNNFIETHDSRTMASQGIKQSLGGAAGLILLNTEQPQSNSGPGARKAPNSAHHSKKPSGSGHYLGPTSSNQSQIGGTSGPQSTGSTSQKKTTKEKYIELKALYNDLLERHFVQQQTYQQPIITSQPPAKQMLPSQTSHQNIINFYPNMNDIQPTSSTPRINTITNQFSQQAIPQNLYELQAQTLILQHHLQQQQQQPISKSIKHQTLKVNDPNFNDSISIQMSKPINHNNQLSQKAALKLNVPQGQSRKIVGSGNHKRSVSDGNEQLFKFKQQAMQRYLYPQPSNQVLQNTQAPSNTEETLGSSRSKIVINPIQGGPVSNPYQPPSHQRRVSDDYNQKQKKSQLHLQQQLNGNQSQISQKQENVPAEGYIESQKPTPIDFNIKSFLLEMRNKQEKNGAGFINIIDENNQSSPNNNIKKAEKNGKQFAMIIEENSPSQLVKDAYNAGYTGTLDSNRKMSLIDSQSQLLIQQASKPNIEFNQILQKYKQMKLDEKRSSSPNLQLEFSKNKTNSKKALPQATHKRVKSDIPEIPKKSLAIGGPQSLHHPTKQPGPTSLNKKTINQSSGNNLIFGSDKNTPKKIINKQPQFAFQIGSNSQFDASSSKKVINVSIDLVRDAADMDRSSVAEDSQCDKYENGGHWIIMDKSTQELNIDSILQKKQAKSIENKKTVAANNKGISFSGGSNNGQRMDKYKKMAQRFDGESSNPVSKNELNKNKYTIDTLDKSGGPNSPSTLNAFHLQISPKGRLSIVEKDSILGQKKSQKLFLPQSPKQPQILQMQSKQIHQQHQKYKVNTITQSVNQQPKKLQVQSSKQVPNNINAAPPNNSVVQTQESARNSLIITTSNLNIQNLQQLPGNHYVGERLDTQDSAVSDPNMSPRIKAFVKLTKHVKLSFKQTQQAPNTTVDFYRIGKVLGKGAFGKVNLALHKLTQKFVAVKSINKQYLSEEAQTKKVMQEVVILKRTRHRNIVRLYEFFETQKHILFVIELCAGGDLLNYVRKRRRLKEDVAKVVFKQIVDGLGYCHSKGILHRDIKLDNILLDNEGEVKICDFGVSKIVKKGEIMTEQCGTPAYIAPEILRDKGYEGFQVDVWSAGVVLYAMLYGTVPFKANNMSELQKLIIKAKYTLKDDISEESRDLLTGLLEKDPSKRLTIPQILQHEWLKDVDQIQKLELFTEQEKEYIKNEFTYNDADRYNRNETDPFTEHHLDSTQNSMLKNQTSKSVILAPFNSTKSNLDMSQPTLTPSMREMMVSKRCLKFAARARDADKQYEMNNNADLDNGVYHKVDEEEKKEEENKEQNTHNSRSSDDSLKGSFNKETIRSEEDEETQRIQKEKKKKETKKQTKEKQTELEKLESLIYQQEEQNNDQNNDDDPYGSLAKQNNDEILIKDEAQNLRKSPRQIEQQNYHQQVLLQSAQTLIIDDQTIPIIESYGYPKEYIIKSLNNNELNYATTSYYLLQNNHGIAMKGDEQKGKLTNRQFL